MLRIPVADTAHPTGVIPTPQTWNIGMKNHGPACADPLHPKLQDIEVVGCH